MNEPRSTAVIEAQLRQAAGEVVWPATPDLRSSVLSRLDGTPTRRSVVPRRALRTAVAVAVLLVVAVLAHPGARTAVAEFFGLVEGYRIEIVPTAAPAGPSAAPSTPTPSGRAAVPLGFASQTTLEAAASAVGFAPALPAGEPKPDVYLARFGEQTLVILRYSRFDLWQSREGVPVMMVKTLPDGHVVQNPQVHGRTGFWIAGIERSMRFVDADGHDIPGSARTVGRNALIWNGVSRLYRLETDLPLAEALRLADSLP